jgi:hypothetical protein
MKRTSAIEMSGSDDTSLLEGERGQILAGFVSESTRIGLLSGNWSHGQNASDGDEKCLREPTTHEDIIGLGRRDMLLAM